MKALTLFLVLTIACLNYAEVSAAPGRSKVKIGKKKKKLSRITSYHSYKYKRMNVNVCPGLAITKVDL